MPPAIAAAKQCDFQIQQMSRCDAKTVMGWAAAEGWNPGKYDADCFYYTDPHGFFIGEYERRPVGSISAVAYDDTFGFVGLFIVLPEHRGNPLFGVQLGREALDYLGDRNVGLDGVLAKVESYRRFGFELAYRNLRFQGIGGGRRSSKAIAAEDVPLEDLAAYDRLHFPAYREDFLERWITQPGACAFALKSRGQITGFGVIRPCVHGWKIGPLFADDPKLADTLLQTLMSCAPNQSVYLDIPEVNPAALELASRYQMRQVFETARMYSQEKPRLAEQEIFGITSFELG